MLAVILLLFFKNKVSLSDATVCVDASKECLQFSNKSQSQGPNAQICENPTASFQKCFSCLFWYIVVKMKMCQQIKNVFKLIFYIKGIPQNFCPSEALQGSWQASYPFRASQQASYLFRASQQASYLFRASQQASYLFFRASQQASYLFRASQQALYCLGPLSKPHTCLGPLSKPQSPFRASWQASIPIQGLLASLNPHSGPLGKSQALLGPPGKPQALFRALKELFSQDSLDEPKIRTLCNLSLSLYIYISQVKKKLKKTIIL